MAATGVVPVQKLLSVWYGAGFLSLKEVTWDSRARTLEWIIKHEKVHPTDQIGRFRQRFGERLLHVHTPSATSSVSRAPAGDNAVAFERSWTEKHLKCYALFHSSEFWKPVAFVHVALLPQPAALLCTSLCCVRAFQRTFCCHGHVVAAAGCRDCATSCLVFAVPVVSLCRVVWGLSPPSGHMGG